MRPLIWATVMMWLAAPLMAQSFAQEVMRPGLLAQEGTLRYLLTRQIGASEAEVEFRKLEPLDQVPTLLRTSAEGLILAQEQEGKERALGRFPPAAPNPILLMFLENVMRALAQETGGSPHYFRNRIRTTIGDLPPQEMAGGERAIRYQPFLEAKERGRMGPYGTLELEIRWRGDNPPRLTRLLAHLPETPEGYREELLLEGEHP